MGAQRLGGRVCVMKSHGRKLLKRQAGLSCGVMGGGQAVLVLERCYASLASPPESAQCHSLPLMMSSHLATVDLGRAAELGACWG